MRYSEFKCKEVINVKNCISLGHVCDIEFDECGDIHKLIVPGKTKLFQSLFSDSEVVIPYRNIKQIGPDIILVEI